MTLREQVVRAIADDCGDLLTPAESASLSDAVLAVFAERERLLRELPYQQGYMDAKRELRERIEALEPPHDYVGLNAGRVWYEMRAAALEVFDDEP